MTKVVEYSAFPATNRNQHIAKASANGERINFGWIPRKELTSEQKLTYDAFVTESPRFGIRGRFPMASRRNALWMFGKRLLGRHQHYTWQQTGSCVGAGGDNLLKTGMCVELAVNGKPATDFHELWWLYIYGRSRFHAGLRGRGEGSWEGAWKKALLQDGHFEHDPQGAPDLPDPRQSNSWLVQPANTELQWSDGAKIENVWINLGRQKLYKTAAYLKSADQVAEALINGYPVAQASMFGFSPMVPKVQGSQYPVRLVVSWNNDWAHKTWIDEYWDHPELGPMFRWGNNWGPTAHGSPTGDEPTGGVYITHKVMDQICKDSDSEVVAYSPHDGFPAREEELNYAAF